jgi:hypothetical protein
VWSYTVRDNSRWTATPIVANGLMYIAEGSGRVIAFDVPTGEVEWIHTRTFPEDISSSEGYPRDELEAFQLEVETWQPGERQPPRQLLSRRRRARAYQHVHQPHSEYDNVHDARILESDDPVFVRGLSGLHDATTVPRGDAP